jgi:hypothetical protein
MVFSIALPFASTKVPYFSRHYRTPAYLDKAPFMLAILLGQDIMDGSDKREFSAQELLWAKT